MTQNSSASPEAAAGAVRPGAWLWAGLALLLAGWTFFPILIHFEMFTCAFSTQKRP